MSSLCPIERGDEFAIITCPMRLKDICCRIEAERAILAECPDD